MTIFKAYDELTWPEVSSLPRDIPLVLPLGGGYSLNLVSETLKNPDEIMMLPSFPFGWIGSGLSVSEINLSNYISNIIYSLHEDGFTNTLVITPQGINLPLACLWIGLHQDPSLPTNLLDPGNNLDKVILIPIGHTEQHGLHLPLSTDTLIIDAIAQGTVVRNPALASLLPVMPYGVSTHRQSFAGTLNSGGRAFEDFWLNVIDTLVGIGFEKFYFTNGHGGNSSFITNVVKYAGERHKHIFCATSWLYLSGPDGIESLERHRQSSIGGMGHACELETSLILFLEPSLVHMERVADETDFVTTPSYYMDWVGGGALIANPPWDDDTKTGAYGSGSLGTAEKGKIWCEAAIVEKADHVREIQEQHKLRQERRKGGFGLWGK